MRISGFFTVDEMTTATDLGAKLKNLKGGQREIIFEQQVVYEKWMDMQKKDHPDRWSQLIQVTPKNC